MTEASNTNDASRPPQAGEMLERALLRARWTTFWERLWPPLATLATAIGLFLAVSWLGVWLWLPPIARAVALFGFLVLTAAATVPLVLVRFPSRHDGLRRLDRNAGLPHRPATTIGDELATAKADPWSVALWRAHVERALLAAQSLKAGRPSPRLDLRDPVALRALVLILVVDDLHRGRRRTRPPHRRGVRLAGRGGAGEFPPRRLGVAADLYGEAARDPARPAAGRARPDLGRRRVGAGRQRAGDPRQRQGPVRRRRPPAAVEAGPGRAASAGAGRHRGAPLSSSPTAAPPWCMG